MPTTLMQALHKQRRLIPCGITQRVSKPGHLLSIPTYTARPKDYHKDGRHLNHD